MTTTLPPFSPSSADEQRILRALEAVSVDTLSGSPVEAGMVRSIACHGDQVGVVLQMQDSLTQAQAEAVRVACAEAVERLEGVTRATVVLTADVAPASPPAAPAEPPPAEAPGAAPAGRPKPPTPKKLEGVRHIVAVAAGKGGVGKSTIAANLAVAFAQQGLRTGLVDADIYGPSLARMMGMEGKPEIEGKQMVPPTHHGVQVLSMGVLTEENKALVWRGPMLSKALSQLMLGARWGTSASPLDVLVMDMPPGTGDVALSLAQRFTLFGVVMVSTPQDVALMDVARAVSMCRSLNVPLLGVVENMAFFDDPTGGRHYPFGQEGVKRFCKEHDVPLLGEIPLDARLAASGDAGVPFVTAYPQDPTSQIFTALARHLTDSF